jgi:hypothetical protein
LVVEVVVWVRAGGGGGGGGGSVVVVGVMVFAARSSEIHSNQGKNFPRSVAVTSKTKL